METFPFVLLTAFSSVLCGPALAKVKTHPVNNTGVVDAKGHCVCTIMPPEDAFPVQRMELLEKSARNLTQLVQLEMQKIQRYEQDVNDYETRLNNVTRRLQLLEQADVTPTPLDFQELHKEIQDLEKFVGHLKSSLNGSDATVETLHREIQNMSQKVHTLESLDKNNVLAVKRELNALKQRLANCQRDKPQFGGQVSFGMCNPRGLRQISKPTVVQLNWRGSSYKCGAWGKESAVQSGMKNIYWVAPLNTDSRRLDTVRLHATYRELLLYKNPTDIVLPGFGQGAGLVLYNGSFFYNCFNGRDLCRMNLDSNIVERKVLANASFNNRFSYASTSWQGIDLASDENGLWVLYATERSEGNLVIGRVNSATLMLEKTWVTSQFKPSMTNAFMVCGVLYATRAVSTHREEIFYSYDTKTTRETWLSIPLEKVTETVQSLSYNPNDRKLYMYSDGYLLSYDVFFHL